MQECAYINTILNITWVLDIPKFWIWQGSQYESITQPSEYARICLDRVLNFFLVLNMPGFWIWQSSEYAKITQGSKYAIQGSEYVWIGHEYA